MGGRGSIGSRLVTALRAAGHECLAPDRGDADTFRRDLGHVVYAIGVTADFRTRPYDAMRAHVSVLADVLEHSRFASLLYLSSARIYRLAGRSAEDSPLAVDPADPESLYDASKIAGESLCLNHPNSAVRVARLSNVLSASEGPTFLSQLLQEARSKGEVLFRSALDSERDFVLLEDVLSLLPTIATSATKRIYNVASGINISNGKIATLLESMIGCSVHVAPGATVARFPVIDISRARREFGFAPSPPEAMIRQLVSRAAPAR